MHVFNRWWVWGALLSLQPHFEMTPERLHFMTLRSGTRFSLLRAGLALLGMLKHPARPARPAGHLKGHWGSLAPSTLQGLLSPTVSAHPGATWPGRHKMSLLTTQAVTFTLFFLSISYFPPCAGESGAGCKDIL